MLCLITVSAIRVFHWFAEEAGIQCKGLFLKRANVCEYKTVKVKRKCMRSQKGMFSQDANLCCGGDTLWTLYRVQFQQENLTKLTIRTLSFEYRTSTVHEAVRNTFPVHFRWDTMWSRCRGCHGNNTSQRCDTSATRWIYMTRHRTMLMFITWEHPDHTVAAQPSAFGAEPVLVWMQPVSKLYTFGQPSSCLRLEIFSSWGAEEPKEPLAHSLGGRPRLAGKAPPRSTDGMCLTPCLRAELFHKCSTIDPACSRRHSGPKC